MLERKTFGNKRSSKRSAFTLIELSIVLIIIGLLVAGITGGASLIKSAQLRSVMSEARGYNVAVNSFVVQYDELPGDYNVSFTGTLLASSAGDRNGRIEWVNGNTAVADDVAEGISAWIQLVNTSTIDETLTYTAAQYSISDAETFAPGAAGVAYPDSKLDGVGWLFDYTTNNSTARNVLILTGAISTTAVAHTNDTPQNLVPTLGITPTDTLSIDSKLDDGVANTGRVRASAAVATPANCFVTATYTTTVTTKACAIEFTVDIS